MRFFLKSRVKCLSSHSVCIHMIICIWKCPCKCVCMWASELLCVSLGGSTYSCTTICASPSVNVAVQTCLPLHRSTCPSVYPFLLSLCSLRVRPVFLWMSPHFCTPVPRVCMYVSCCQWMHLCVVHTRPCEHSSWYVWDLWAHISGCPVSVFMSVWLWSI